MMQKDLEKEKSIKLLLQSNYSSLPLHIGVYEKDKTLYSQYVQVKGSRILEIPLKNTTSEELEVQVSGVKNNSGIYESFRIKVPKTEDFLKITTQTFRSKLQPGIEETWSFKIENTNDKTPDAEILASMYDMSLDQFKTQTWNTNPQFGNSYASFPSYSLYNTGSISSLINRFPSPWRYRVKPRNFDRLRLFGFIMSSPDSYAYRRYLRNKNIQKDTEELAGNTRGKVTDAQGLALPGVNVVIDGTGIGTTSNFHGEFALDTQPGDQLVFSYVGFKTERALVDKDREVYVSLSADASQLDEVVTVGYGEQRQADAEEDGLALLQGKVAGVEVTSANTVKIRGMSSSAEDGLLYVVDGKKVTDYEVSAEEILSVKVLKPEEATALYGSSAAQGAVIITTKKGMQDLQKVEARKDLDETAFFFPDLRLGKDGRLEFSFTTPEALTQWKLRLLAHTKNWTTGSYESTVRTQKELSVVPNPPRFLREKDTIVFKSKITNLTAEAMTGTAMLELYDALSMEPIDQQLGNIEKLQTFNVSESGSTIVAWKLIIPKGVQAVTYRVLAKAGDFSDGEENFLPVLTNRLLVKESLPFFVRAGETESYILKNMQENDSQSLEHHKYTLEYSSIPAWYALQSLPYLMDLSTNVLSRLLPAFTQMPWPERSLIPGRVLERFLRHGEKILP